MLYDVCTNVRGYTGTFRTSAPDTQLLWKPNCHTVLIYDNNYDNVTAVSRKRLLLTKNSEFAVSFGWLFKPEMCIFKLLLLEFTHISLVYTQ